MTSDKVQLSHILKRAKVGDDCNHSVDVNGKDSETSTGVSRETIITLSVPAPLLICLAQSSAGGWEFIMEEGKTESECIWTDLNQICSTASDSTDAR